jgi:DNA invertase Pin-like site-specific DNA recombinase/chaperonin cofactor prefoldin
MSLPIALYLRKSSGKKDDNVSIERQRKQGLKYVKDNNLKHIVFEEVVSASRKGRKQFISLLNHVVNKKVSGIWVWDLNRIDRRMTDYISLRDEITDLHNEDNFDVLIHVSGMKYECWNPNHRQLLGFNAVMNEAVKDFIVKSTKEAKISMLNKGLDVNGNVGYGFIRNKGIISINQNEARWVREVYRVFLLKSIQGYNQCYKHLLKLHKNLDKNIGESLVIKILTHKRYYGLREQFYNKKLYTINTDEIISKELFDEVRLKIDLLSKSRKRYQKQEYVLKTKVFCGCCDNELWVLGGTTKYKYYACNEKIRKQRLKNSNINKWAEKYGNLDGCGSIRNNKISIPVIDEVVWNTLFDVMKKSKYVFKELRKRYDDDKIEYKKNYGKLTSYQRELDSLKENMKKTLIKSVKLGLDLEDDLTIEFNNRRKHIELRISELSKTNEELDLIEDDTTIKDNILKQLDITHKNKSYSNLKYWIDKYISKVSIKRLTNKIKHTEYDIRIDFIFGNEDINEEFKLKLDNENISILKNGTVQIQNQVSKSRIKFSIVLNIRLQYPKNQHKVIYTNYNII